MQNKMQIKGKWSRSEPEVEFQYGRRLFFQTRSRYISAINWYMVTIEVDEIWFVDKFWPEGKDINKYETGSSIERPGSHLEKSIGRYISVVAVDPKWHDNNGDEVKMETE